MSDKFIDIETLIPERLRDEPLLKDCVAMLDHIYYEREQNVNKQLDDIRDKYTTYLLLARQEAHEVFLLSKSPDATVITPTVYMDEPLIKRERFEQNFGVGTHQFISTVLSLEPVEKIIEGLAVTSLVQISDVTENMLDGYFEENCLYEITCELPVTIEFTGLQHGLLAPIDRIEDPTLGLVYNTYNLRESDLYALEPDFPYHVFASTEGFEWVIKGHRHTSEDLDLSRERNSQVVNEFGYQYLLDALGMSALDVALIRSFITVIHQLKGSRQGVDLIIDLLELRDYVQLFEWWEDDPTGETVDEMSYRAEVDLTNEVNFNSNTLQALRLFLRQYVYPILADFALIVNFADERLKTAYNVLTHQTVNGTMDTPVVITPLIRTFQTLPCAISSPVMTVMQGLAEREYNVTMNSVVSEATYEMAETELNTGFNVLPHMEVTGSTSTQVLIALAGVGHSRFHGAFASPIMISANGLVDREFEASFADVSTEYSVEFDLHFANGTQGFVKQEIHAQAPSPMLLLIGGTHDRDYHGQVTGDINDAPSI
jgi:hypothetical protein